MKGWEMIAEIKRLTDRGDSVSAIARRLGIDRKTVRKYRDMPFDKAAEYRASATRRRRETDGFEELIAAVVARMREDGIVNAQSINDQLRQAGYRGSARTVRRYVANLLGDEDRRSRIYEPFETDPGAQAMVDIGESRKVWIDDRRTVRYFICMTLSYSRKMYAEWFDRPISTEMFIDFHQRGFAVYGGVPGEIVYDQTKLVVIREQYGEAEFNQRFAGLSRWFGFAVYLCRKHDPETKGKVEASVRYVKRGFLPGRRFADQRDFNAQFSRWMGEVADVKPNETTGAPPLERWREERPLLQPLRDEALEIHPSYRRQRVYKNGLIKVLGNRYSVPWRYHRKTVKVRVTAAAVEVVDERGAPICSHERCLDKGKLIKVKAHYARPRATPTESLVEELNRLYKHEELAAKIRREFPRHYRDQYKQLIALAESIEPRFLRDACAAMFKLGCVSYKNIKMTAEMYMEQCYRDNAPAMTPPTAPKPPPAMDCEQRPLTYYDDVMEANP